MASPQSSVDMDISDGSDLDRASHSSDMEVSNNSEDEISQTTSNITLNNNINDVPLAQQMRIPPSNDYYYKPPPSYPRVYEVTNQSTASLYTQGLPIVPPNAESYYSTQAPVVTEGYQYFNYQQPAHLSSSTLHNHPQQSMYHNSNQSSFSMDLTVGTATKPIVLDDVDEGSIGEQEKRRQGVVIDDDDDSDSLSSYVTAPLYTVNESEEEGLIRDEDEDDMETLGWYKHNVQKLDTEIEKTRKSKRALEEELLRLQIKLSVEKNKMNSIMKKKNEKKKKKRKVTANIDKGKKRMDTESFAPTSFVPEEQQRRLVSKSLSSTPPTPAASLPASPYKSTSPTVAQKQIARQSHTSSPITSKLQKPVETTTIKPTVPKAASSLTNVVSQPSLPLPSASGTVITNKSIKTKGLPSSTTAPVPSPVVQKSTVSALPSTTSKSIPSKVSSSITSSTSQKAPSFPSPKVFNKPNSLTNVNKKPPVPSNITPPTRVNAITQKNSSSINPASKNVIQHHSKGAFKPYESPLRRFGFSHMDMNGKGANNDNNMMSSGIIISSNGVSNNSNNNNVDNGNSEDMNRELCRYETVGGTCNDDTCQALHFRDFQ